MDLFYEVRRQLRDSNRWVHEAYFRNKNDAEQFIEYRSKWIKERIPAFININHEIDEHKFSKFPSDLTTSFVRPSQFSTRPTNESAHPAKTAPTDKV